VTYRSAFVPDCLPTAAVPAPGGDLTIAMPSRDDLARANLRGPGHRVVLAYDLVCALLAEARLHLAHTLPDNWPEHPDMVAAVEYLGGADALAELRDAESIDEARLP
jgi:hypothetical protein